MIRMIQVIETAGCPLKRKGVPGIPFKFEFTGCFMVGMVKPTGRHHGTVETLRAK